MRRAEKPLRYGEHARERMRQRSISEKQVEQAVYYPQVIRPARRRGAGRFEKQLSTRRRLAVIAEERTDLITIISAFWI